MKILRCHAGLGARVLRARLRAALGLRAPDDRVRLEANGLYNLLQLSRTSRIIDIGCGHGRHAIALAERGPDVIALDFADALLSRAHRLAVESGTPVRLVRGDMRQLPFPHHCADAAVVIDAFGFFERDDENEAVLREAARVLRTGGSLALKVVNGGLVLDDFRETEREERDGVAVSVSNTLTEDPPRLMQRISISGSRGAGEYERRQRLYRVEELHAALARAGFSAVDVFASPDGAPFESSVSPSMWLAGQRAVRSERVNVRTQADKL